MTEQIADPLPRLPRAAAAELSAHQSSIAALASDLRVSETEVLDAYAFELGQFVDARIQMFVPLLVGKRVRRRLLGLHKDLTARTSRH
jgi:hypothetical protein